MAVYCVNNDYCVTGTGYPAYDDVYTQSGIYNVKDYYVGNNNGYYIFYSNDGYWCLSTALGGSCFLRGKYPCVSVCPDLTSGYVSATICATPTPTATVNCDVFNFEAVFKTNINPTPTPSYSPTPTQTLTPSPSSTNYCPTIYVDASIISINPTPTPTLTMTPTIINTRFRNFQIECNFIGDVTFVTIDSVITCPVSKQFQDCNDGMLYYTTNVLENPSGGDLSQFMIFLGNVDGQQKCITYLGTNSNFNGINNITLISGPIGFSNLGDCSLCSIPETPTPTPTLTPTITPSPGLQLETCTIFYIFRENIYSFNVNTEVTSMLPITNVPNWTDIANTETKLFVSNNDRIREWNITLSPFSATFIRELDNIDNSITFSDGLFAISNTKLITCNVENGVYPQTIIEINLPPTPTNSLNSSNYNALFTIQIDREFSGDLLVTTTDKIILTNRSVTNSNYYITQYDYNTGEVEVDVNISPDISNPIGLFVDTGILYIMNGDGTIFTISLSSPYTITPITSLGSNIGGSSQFLNCVDIQFDAPPTIYYQFRLCNDTVGPQTIIYQTLPSIATNSTQTILNLADNTCWDYFGYYTTIPQSSTNDIIVYEGNYFTEVSSTIYIGCAECTNANPCQTPTEGLLEYSLIGSFSNVNGSTIIFRDFPIEDIFGLYNDIKNDGTAGVGQGSTPAGSESLTVGSYVYSLLVIDTNCQCIRDGSYIYKPTPFNSWPETIQVITIQDCNITEINSFTVVYR